MTDTRSERAPRRRELALAAVGVVCLVLGVVIAVEVPEETGPAWAMAVAGCLAAGVLLIARAAVVLIRSGRDAAL